jgi:3-isopropylmalate/(R)-2-methylmalate dehydratase small subunit
VDAEVQTSLFDLTEEAPMATLTIDLASQSLILPDGRKVTFPIDGFSKSCLLNGVDELGYILGFERQIAAYEQKNGIIIAN